jgi:hypothetical protein
VYNVTFNIPNSIWLFQKSLLSSVSSQFDLLNLSFTIYLKEKQCCILLMVESNVSNIYIESCVISTWNVVQIYLTALFICVDALCRYHFSFTSDKFKVSEIWLCEFGWKRRAFVYYQCTQKCF